MKKCLLIVLATIQLISCSKDDSLKEPIKKDEVLKGDVTSIISNNFARVTDVAIDQNGDLYVTDSNDRRIKKIKTSDGSNAITTFAGNNTALDIDGVGTSASFHNPQTLTFSKDYKILYVGSWRKIRAIDVATKQVTTVAGSGAWGGADGIGAAAEFAYPTDIVLNTKGTKMYVSEHIGSVNGVTKRLREIDLSTQKVTTLSWSSLPTSFSPQQMIVDSKDENLYLASTKVVLKMNLQTKNVAILAGSNIEQGTVDGVAENARFDNAYSLSFSPNETYLYVGQGNGQGRRAIRKINMETKEVTTLVGGTYGFTDGAADVALFKDIYGMSYDKNVNKLYVADTFNNAIRIIK